MSDEWNKFADGVLDCGCHPQERWRDLKFGAYPYAEHYSDGDIQFLFDDLGEVVGASHFAGDGGPTPAYISAVHAEVAGDGGKVGDLAPDPFADKCGIIARWNEQLVFVDHIEIVDEIEVVVPSRVRLKTFYGSDDLWSGPLYQSVFQNSLKVFLAPSEGELDPLKFLPGGEQGREDAPNNVVECGAEAVDSVTADQRKFAYDGFVAFSSGGAFTRLCIVFKSVGERARFAEQFIGIRNVFFGPLDL